MGLVLGWFAEKNWPANGLWMMGLPLFFFTIGLYAVVKSSYLKSQALKNSEKLTKTPSSDEQ
jgi:F0F1-type ATP synthase assembly protein I